MDKRRGVTVAYPDLSEVLKSFLGKLIKHRLDKRTARCIENWLKCQVQLTL